MSSAIFFGLNFVLMRFQHGICETVRNAMRQITIFMIIPTGWMMSIPNIAAVAAGEGSQRKYSFFTCFASFQRR